MRCIVIDYSDLCFNPVPSRRGGKFIQLMDSQAEYIVMSPKDLSAFHANIAERFLASQGVRGRYNSKRDHFRTGHPGWAILGGGHWEMDEEAGELKLSGTSMAYGRFQSSGLARRMEASMPGLRIRIGS